MAGGQSSVSIADKAGIGRRLLAVFVDLIFLSLVSGIVADSAGTGGGGGGSLLLLLSAVYAIFFWVLAGATPGKLLFGLKIVTADGATPRLTTAVVRYLGYWVNLLSLGLGFLWILLDRDRQGWHDKIAGTYVIRSPRGPSVQRQPTVTASSTGSAVTELQPSSISPMATGTSMDLPASPRWVEQLDSLIGSFGRSTDPADAGWGTPAQRAAALDMQRFITQVQQTTAMPPTEEAALRQRASEISVWRSRFDELWARLVAALSEEAFNPSIGSRLQALKRHQWARHQREQMNALLWKARLSVAEPEAAEAALRAAFSVSPEPLNLEISIVDRTAYLRLSTPLNLIPVTVTETRQTTRGTTQVVRPRPPEDVNRDYKDRVADRARKTAHLVFSTVPGIDEVVVSLFQPHIHPTLGYDYSRCVLSVCIDRENWYRIIHERVTAENALRNFDPRFRYNQKFELQEVAPIALPGSAAEGDDPLILHEMDPLDFEELVKNLLVRMGFLATLTKASRDGGIDIEAVNPEPIVGGKVIVQCKRYTGTIGSPTVRDLYGAVTATRSSKGILITTSDFSADARGFAEDKPLELINGQQLTELLHRHGFNLSPVAGRE